MRPQIVSFSAFTYPSLAVPDSGNTCSNERPRAMATRARESPLPIGAAVGLGLLSLGIGVMLSPIEWKGNCSTGPCREDSITVLLMGRNLQATDFGRSPLLISAVQEKEGVRELVHVLHRNHHPLPSENKSTVKSLRAKASFSDKL